jgi:hypothetical protein
VTTPITRPTGITVLAVLTAIAGVLLLLGGFAAVFGGALLGGVVNAPLGGLVALIGVATLVLGAVYFFSAFGLWNLRVWAWQLAVIASIAQIVLTVIQYLGGAVGIGSVVIQVLISGLILWYLNQPPIRAAFNRA